MPAIAGKQLPMKTLKGEDLTKIREVCLTNTYAFGKFICGFIDMDPDLHGEMGAWVQKPTRIKLGQAPRGFLKTTTWTISDKLRRATANPGMRILLVNETAANSEKWIGQMQAIVQSEQFRAFFPDVVPNIGDRRVKWNASQLELARKQHWPEATFEAIGVGGASTSRHYDIICNDDLVGKEARESPSVMEKAIDQRKLSWSLMINPSQSEIHDFGTRWAPMDLIDWILKNVKNVDHKLITLFDKHGLSRWPQRFTAEAIEQIRQEQGPEMWALQYLNRAVGMGASKFDPDLLKFWRMEEDGEGKETFVLETPFGDKRIAKDDCLGYQVIDAGLSPESEDARTANVTAFLTPPTATEPFDIIIAEAKATRSTPAEVVSEAAASYQRWNPLYASIETFGGHQAFFGWLSTTYPTMRIRELKKDFSRNAKHKRINGFWGSYPNQGRVYVHRRHTDLLDELVSYPNGTTMDLLDAGGYLPTVWAPPNPAKPTKLRRPGISDFDLSDYDPEELSRMVSEGRSELTGY
jgi:hypothetical protein